jgi:hypothetical protein
MARKLLAVLPNSADPERVFSELGRMITLSRTSLADAQSSRMLFIAAYCRAQEREDAAGGGSVMQRTAKKFSERAAAVVRLNSIGHQSVAVLSDIPQGGVVEVQPAGQSAAGESAAQAARDEPAARLGPVEEEVAEEEEGVDVDCAAQQTEDEAVSALAMADPVTFAARFAEAVSASGLDTDDLEAPGLEADAVHKDFEIYAMGNLPDENDHDIPQDTVSVEGWVVGGALRRQRCRKTRAHDVHRRHCRVNLCFAPCVYEPCARLTRPAVEQLSDQWSNSGQAYIRYRPFISRLIPTRYGHMMDIS